MESFIRLSDHNDPQSRRSIWVNGPVIVGAGPSGLTTAACLREQGVPFVVLERANCIASLWQKRTYDRLKLHLPKQFCQLPNAPIPEHYPEYPSKKQFVEYLESYATRFDIKPRYNVCVQSARFDRTFDLWRLKTVSGGAEVEFICQWLVVATGEGAERVVPEIDGLDEFAGGVLHACDYKSGDKYRGQKVLVVGCGNSGMEVSLDLCNHNALPAMVVRSSVHVLPREILGKSTSELAILLLMWLPLWIVEKLLLIMAWFVIGNTSKYGIKRPEIGPLELNNVHGKTPVMDVGALEKIRAGQIAVVPGIKRFSASQVELVDGRRLDVDSVILATGYRSNVPSWLEIDVLESGQILHACNYKSGEKLEGQKLFVFGCPHFGKMCEAHKFIQAFSEFLISRMRQQFQASFKPPRTPPWKDLLPEMVRVIGAKFVTFVDFIHCSRVCKNWRDSLDAQTHPPLIMAAEEVNELRVFTELLEHRDERIYHHLYVPSIRGQCFWSSHVGYLVCWDKEKRRVRLVNPIFSKPIINLAPVPLFVLDVTKGIITSRPRSGRAVVILLYEASEGRSMMIFTGLKDKTWSALGTMVEWDDVVESGGSYFGCSTRGEIYRLTFGNEPGAVLLTAAPPVLEDVKLRSSMAQLSKFYVVSSGNKLLLLQRCYAYVYDQGETYLLTCYFRAWVIDTKKEVLSIANNIGDRCIFVGRNTSYSFRYSHNNHEQRNLVVYTDDFKEQYDKTHGCDFGMFDLGKKEVVWTVAPAFSAEQDELYSSVSPSVVLIPMSKFITSYCH